MSKWRMLIINGPNLNLLGVRETSMYGSDSLKTIEALCLERAEKLNIDLAFFQSNFEGELVEAIQQAHQIKDLIIINPAAYTHTSIAIRDALLAINLPLIEVHLSNIYRRETFRHHSMIRDIAIGQIAGFGKQGYLLALEAGLDYLDRT
ncbi:type II 3-dehydroquinate dehydratase [Magnetococcales bacterium HHB-1]